ncbi:MAG: hypothetical protein ACXW5U_29710 [Thermoanaerobaculia bacterium]
MQYVDTSGPAAYENWRAASTGAPLRESFEYPLYSDARFTGEVTSGLGPHMFFNPVAIRQGHGIVRSAVVLRVGVHLADTDETELGSSDPGSYHGGWLVDELAALSSLLTGARIRAGAESRQFGKDDPAGRPVAWDLRAPPSLATNSYGVVLPSAAGEHSLMVLEELQSFPKLLRADAIALVRAARLYQDALWIVESEPNLAWIMLVSAVECAANRWRVGKDEPMIRIRAEFPDLVAAVQLAGGPTLVQQIALTFANSLGSTAKFVDFVLGHKAAEPSVRPDEWGQVDWEDHSLRKALRVIYGHRSSALHDGIPFPLPLCRPVQNVALPSERPIAIAERALGGSWLAKDLPMFLHVFEYIARHSIVGWWRTLAG